MIRDEFSINELSPFLFAANEIHLLDRDAQYKHYLETWTQSLKLYANRDGVPWGASDILGVCAVGSPAGVLRAASRILEHPDLEPEVFTTYNGDAFLKVRRGGHDKGTALRQIAERLGVPMEETVVVGDWINDIPMFRVAGRSFAMNEADERTIDEAHDVLVSARGSGGGVAEVIARVWGL